MGLDIAPTLLLLFIITTCILLFLVNLLWTRLRKLKGEHYLLQSRLDLLISNGLISAWEWDASTDSFSWDKGCLEMYGIHSDCGVCTNDWMKSVHPDDASELEKSNQLYLDDPTTKHYELYFRTITPSGDIRHIRSLRQIIRNDQQKISKLIGVDVDDTQLRKIEEDIRNLARTDFLTGAYNRRGFTELANTELQRTKRSNRPLSALLLDIDFFKKINDDYGHPAGDKVLAELCTSVGAELRGTDFLGRLGGEEFAILLTETPVEQATQIAERVRSRLENTPVQYNQKTIQFSVSIGVAETENNHVDIEMLLEKADRALYQAKAHGRNRVEVA